MTETSPRPFSKQQVRDAFNKAAKTYDAYSIVQQEVCKRLLERLEYIKIEPQTILDLGAGTGQSTSGLAQCYPEAHIIAMDLAEKMLLINRSKTVNQSAEGKKSRRFFRTGFFRSGLKSRRTHQFVCADAEQLPFADASMDIIFSSLTIQWCFDLNLLFNEFRRVLKPGGLIMFTTLGAETLNELRASWAAVSDKIHVNEFTDMHLIGDALYNAQVENPVMDNEKIILNYQSIKQILVELKAVGADNKNSGREKALTGKKRLQAMYDAYEQFRTEAGYPVTYEVLYGHAWNPKTPMQNTSSAEGKKQTSISLAQLKSSLRS